MKKATLFILLLVCWGMTPAQQLLQENLSTAEADSSKASKDPVFTTIIELPITSIKNQNKSSTCWSFSSMSFFESELLRMNKGSYDFSEMFIVHHCMVDRAVQYVRLHGNNSFSPGGSFYDALFCLKNYGLVPQTAMPGIMYGDTLPVHGELDAVAGAYVNAIAKGKFAKLSPVWKQGLERIYDTYLGEYPEHFEYEGKDYTPLSFAASLGLNADDYISITSYTHHPFYTSFAVEVEDNWRLSPSFNLPLDEMMAVIDHALEKGYTLAWGADVSEKGFSRNGLGVVSEKEITQEMRQKAFDNWESTDDHGMQIFGLAKDQHGTKYYMVKNSWGMSGKYKGIWYVSEDFVRYKTINFIVNKEALPKEIARKL